MYFQPATNVCPPIVHPTKCCVNHTCSKYIVPEIHPSHTTTVNHQHYEHQHYFPHTQSVVNEVSKSDVVMPCPGPGVGPVPRPGYPVPPPGFGPGPFPY